MKTNYFFLHLPKCGGISLRRMLAQDPYYFPVFSHHQTGMRAEQYFRSYRGVGGHLPLRIAYRLGFEKAWKFTFLRDPEERLLSHLTYAAVRKDPTSDWDYLRADLAYIKAHLRKELHSEFATYANSYVTYLSTTLDERAPLDEKVASAIANLRGFEFVGHMRTFEEDAVNLARLVGFGSPKEVPRENVSRDHPRSGELRRELLNDAESRELIARCIEGDRQIYEASLAARRPAVEKLSTALAVPSRAVPIYPDERRPEVEILATTVEHGPEVLPGTMLTIHVLLGIHAAEASFDVGLTIESEPDHTQVVSLLTFNQLGTHLQAKAGKTMVHFSLPSWLNKGFYVGHVRIFSKDRAVLAEKSNACYFTVNTHVRPAQFGLLYADVQISANDTQANRTWRLDEARKLELRIDPDFAITHANGICSVPLVFQNKAATPVCSTLDCCYFVSFHIANAQGEPVLYDGHRFPIPMTQPGATTKFVIEVGIPADPACQKLQIRLLQETVRWHEGQEFADQLLPDIELR